MNLHQLLLSAFPLLEEEILKQKNFLVKGLTDNSKEACENYIFVCLKGYRVDGHDFVDQALKNGAAFFVSQKALPPEYPHLVISDTRLALAKLAAIFYDYPTTKFQLIGVTGTNGKTTTTFLVDKILRDQGLKTGLVGTMFAKVVNEKYNVENTTPNALYLQQLFAEMVEKNVEVAVMEVSSHALDEGRVLGCDYDITIFTNLTQDHIDYHETMINYKHSKSLLFSQLGSKITKDHSKFAVLNLDDETSKYYSKITSAHIVTYSIHQKADFMAKDIELSSNGTIFTLHYPKGKILIVSPFIGLFNVYNCLAAIAAAYCYGVSMDDIVRSISNAPSISGRFETVQAGQNFTVIVDYAHTPDSLENVLKTILQFAKNNVYCIVGCGGNRDKTKRPKMAKIACEYATHPIFTSDNPRMEDPKQILLDMEEGAIGSNYIVIEDRREAISYAISNATAGDIILIAGKGHETYQLVKNEVLHFDDKEEALIAIKNKQ